MSKPAFMVCSNLEPEEIYCTCYKFFPLSPFQRPRSKEPDSQFLIMQPLNFKVRKTPVAPEVTLSETDKDSQNPGTIQWPRETTLPADSVLGFAFALFFLATPICIMIHISERK